MSAARPSRWRGAFRPSPRYAVALVTFLTHQFAQRFLAVRLPLADAYLDPFLCIPLLLGLALAEQRWLGWRGAAEPFSAIEIAAMTLALAVLFEEGFPRIDPARQTRDPWDYLAYAAGGLAYWGFSRQRKRGGVGSV